jgi:hypothetical protein
VCLYPFYPACKTHAPYCIIICGSSDCTKFSTLSHRQNELQKNVLKMKYLLWFSLQSLSEIFLILRRIRRDVIINVHVASCKVPLFLWDCNEIWILQTDLRKILKCQFWRKSIRCEQSCSTKINRTAMTKLMVAFRNLANAIKHFTARNDNIREWAKIVHK